MTLAVGLPADEEPRRTTLDEETTLSPRGIRFTAEAEVCPLSLAGHGIALAPRPGRTFWGGGVGAPQR